jgi:pilus assembly protein CpaF
MSSNAMACLKRSGCMRFLDQSHSFTVVPRFLRWDAVMADPGPIVDGRLARLAAASNAIVPPLALGGPCLSIRKFHGIHLLHHSWQQAQSVRTLLEYLTNAVTNRN